MKLFVLAPAVVTLGCLMFGASATAEDGWIVLSNDLKAWQEPVGEWYVAANAQLDPSDDGRLTGGPGQGVLINGKNGRTQNLVTRQQWGDVEVQLEFMIPRRSNSGVKLEGVYEIQIVDSWKVAQPTGSDCGGIYPRAEEKPKYHHIDDGIAPLANAAKPPGEWQTLEIVFRAPRFDVQNEKVANAQFERVVLNGKLIHDHVEVSHPTGHVWREKEEPTGPLLLQADHGAVAFRNIRVRQLAEETAFPVKVNVFWGNSKTGDATPVEFSRRAASR
jgi:hypothetical protein